jgi:hypothetical protein
MYAFAVQGDEQILIPHTVALTHVSHTRTLEGPFLAVEILKREGIHELEEGWRRFDLA